MQVLERPEQQQRSTLKRRREIISEINTETKEEVAEEEEAVKPQKEKQLILDAPGNVLKSQELKKLLPGAHIFAINTISKQMNISTVGGLLQTPIVDVVQATKLASTEIQSLFVDLSKKIAPSRTAVTELLSNPKIQQKRFTYGCPILDKTLGGICTKCITEIYGEAGCGKTQIALQLALNSSLPESHGGLAAKSLYMHSTEFPHSRLKVMAEHFVSKCKNLEIELDQPPGNSIFVQGVVSVDDLWSALGKRIPVLLNNPLSNVKLIIIDSVASLIRHEFDHGDSLEKARVLWLISKQLRRIAENYNVAIVVINETTDQFNPSQCIALGLSTIEKIIPSLGPSWSRCVNTRISVHKTTQYIDGLDLNPPEQAKDDDENDEPPKKRKKTSDASVNLVVREIGIKFSPSNAPSLCNFIVNNQGVQGIN